MAKEEQNPNIPAHKSEDSQRKTMTSILIFLTVMIVLVIFGVINSFEFAPTHIEVFWGVVTFVGLSGLNYFVFNALKNLGTNEEEASS